TYASNAETALVALREDTADNVTEVSERCEVVAASLREHTTKVGTKLRELINEQIAAVGERMDKEVEGFDREIEERCAKIEADALQAQRRAEQSAQALGERVSEVGVDVQRMRESTRTMVEESEVELRRLLEDASRTTEVVETALRPLSAAATRSEERLHALAQESNRQSDVVAGLQHSVARVETIVDGVEATQAARAQKDAWDREHAEASHETLEQLSCAVGALQRGVASLESASLDAVAESAVVRAALEVASRGHPGAASGGGGHSGLQGRADKLLPVKLPERPASLNFNSVFGGGGDRGGSARSGVGSWGSEEAALGGALGSSASPSGSPRSARSGLSWGSEEAALDASLALSVEEGGDGAMHSVREGPEQGLLMTDQEGASNASLWDDVESMLDETMAA
ncbi:hypothetical protein OAN61_00280, partial [bacterium]|nr:hypothetical protein [bacterium]